jgi:hypothetical protein
MRLRDLRPAGITERSAHGIVTDLATGYVLKQDGRRNRYQICPTCRRSNTSQGRHRRAAGRRRRGAAQRPRSAEPTAR